MPWIRPHNEPSHVGSEPWAPQRVSIQKRRWKYGYSTHPVETKKIGWEGGDIRSLRCDAMRCDDCISFFEFSGAKQRRRELDQIIIIISFFWGSDTHANDCGIFIFIWHITGLVEVGKSGNIVRGLCDISVPKRRVPGTSYHVHKFVQSNPMIRAFIIS